MALDSQGVGQGVAGWLTDALTGTAGAAVDGVANLLKEDLPIPGGGGYIIPAIGQEIGRRACRRYADNAAAFDSASAAGFERLCRPYLDDVGYGGSPSIKLPFRGGQCNQKYIVSFVTNEGGQNPSPGTFLTLGPLGGFREEDGPQGSKRVFFRSNSNLVFGGQCFNSVTGNSPRDTLVASYTPDGGTGPRVTGVTPCGSDDCGNAPPIVVGPSAPAIPDPPGPSPFSPVPGIDIDIDVDIPIIVGVGPVIVFDIGVGPIQIDPFPDGDGGDGGDGDGDGPSDGPPGDIGDPAPPQDTGEDGQASGCAPEGSVLVGVKVTVLEAPPFGSEYDPLVRRGVCYAYFGVPGNLALEPSGVALRSGQFLFAPKNNLTCYEIRANTGYNLRVTPYYRALEQG